MSDLLAQLHTCGTDFIANPDNFDAQVFANYIANDNIITYARLQLPRDADHGRDIKIICDGLRNNTTLKELELFSFKLFGNSLNLDGTTIETLKFTRCNLRNCDLSNLFVSSIEINLTTVLSDKQIGDILSGPYLRSLTFWYGSFNNNTTRIIADELRRNKLTKLFFTFCRFTNLFYEALKVNTSLLYLKLFDCNTNLPILVDILNGNKTLKYLELNGCDNDNFAAFMQTNLEEFHALSCDVSKLSPLKGNTSLTHLSLCTTKIDTGEFTILAEILSENTTLKSLCIEIDEVLEIDSDDLKCVIKSLRRNTTLESLYLYPIVNEDLDDIDKDIHDKSNLIIKWLGPNYTLKNFSAFSDMIDSFLSEDERMKRMQTMRRSMTTKRSLQ